MHASNPLSFLMYLSPLMGLVAGLIILGLLFKAYNATSYGGLLVLIGAWLVNVLSVLAWLGFNLSVSGPGAAATDHPAAFYQLFTSLQVARHCLALGLSVVGMGLLLQEFVKLARERQILR